MSTSSKLVLGGVYVLTLGVSVEPVEVIASCVATSLADQADSDWCKGLLEVKKKKNMNQVTCISTWTNSAHVYTYIRQGSSCKRAEMGRADEVMVRFFFSFLMSRVTGPCDFAPEQEISLPSRYAYTGAVYCLGGASH